MRSLPDTGSAAWNPERPIRRRGRLILATPAGKAGDAPQP
jgi:hypothetical protein